MPQGVPQGSRENPIGSPQPCADFPRSGPLGSCSTGVTSAPKSQGDWSFLGVNLSPKMVAVTCFSVSVSPTYHRNVENYSLLLQMKMGKGQQTFQTEAAPASGFGEITAATGQRFPCPEIWPEIKLIPPGLSCLDGIPRSYNLLKV